MIIVVHQNAAEADIQKLVSWLDTFGVQASPIVGKEKTVIGLVGDTAVLDADAVRQWPGGRPHLRRLHARGQDRAHGRPIHQTAQPRRVLDGYCARIARACFSEISRQ